MSSALLIRIRDRVVDKPLLVLPEKLAIITDVLGGRIEISGISGLTPSLPEGATLEDASFMRPTASRFVGDAVDRDENGRPVSRLPYRRTPEGVAIITITGALVNRGAWIGSYCDITSYEGIAHQITTAARDPKVRAILLDIESPGGEAIGAMETAALVRKVAAEKPVYAIVNGMAASAAYAITSGAKAIISTPSGLSGSIGVVMLHTDLSRKLDREGITPTLIHAGAHKVDGHPYAPLSNDIRSDLQGTVDKFYGQFLDTVAAGRGARLTAKAARATEARTFIGADAKAAGLVDDIGAFDDLIGSIARTGAGRSKGKKLMTHMYDESDLAKARAEGEKIGAEAGRKTGFEAGKAEGLKEGHEAGKAEGMKEGVAAERTRFSAILGLESAKGREESARHIAMTSTMTAEEADKMLLGLPTQSTIATRAAATVVSGPGAKLGIEPAASTSSARETMLAAVNRANKR